MSNQYVAHSDPDNSHLARTRKPTALPITPRTRRLIEAMVHDALPLDRAAAEAQMTTRAARLALGKPHIAAFLKSELQVLRSARQPKNFHRLCEIADADNNMPAVNAIKAMEIEQIEQRSNSAPAPGVTVRIVNVIQSNEQTHQRDVSGEIEP